MRKTKVKENKRIGRHKRLRRTLHGTTARPRLCVHRSLGNFYSQVIDDSQGKVLWGFSTLNKEVRGKIKNGGNIEAASALGSVLADAAKKKGITKVCFDRGGYQYHGRIKAFAEAARKNGLEF